MAAEVSFFFTSRMNLGDAGAEVPGVGSHSNNLKGFNPGRCSPCYRSVAPATDGQIFSQLISKTRSAMEESALESVGTGTFT